ncbi:MULTISPECIES: SixA phosphatase family protein [Grimontia]|uniref:Histidine phosphatase superfamily (Branch 1) n=1 Tax=Grimontia marina TaxID=646534 RepID=A0A128F2U3_9GAMM|nr:MULTISPECIES: histidine phosphatase family protein [Grimontia]WRW00610.1 histidine phosphatase family protein [Grimontia sp. NTOU-MAR1]CZF80566.1 Histidine phosphatase superfamily (branch 1) [Grimontia marina]
MKLLFLTRHAKSSWDDPSLDDHDRPLNPRGRRNAPEMGARLAAWTNRPKAIVSSSALRAKTTALLMAEQLPHSPPVIIKNDVYTEDWETLVRVVERFDDEKDSVMLVGHNPAFNEFLSHIPFEIDNLPTCGIAVITLHSDSWSNWSVADKHVLFLDYPKRLNF